MRRLLAAAALAVAVGAVVAAPAAAQSDTGWVIETFDVEIAVQPDGSFDVREQIAVDFGDLDRHGIYRVIPVRYDLVGEDVRVDVPEGRSPDEFLRAIEITGISVSSSAPDDLQVTRPSRVGGRDLTLRIGDEDTTVTGRQTYTISYRVAGALNAFEGHDELYWNVTGNAWPVRIREATATVTAPALTEATCFRGPPGAVALCDTSSVTGGTATFSATRLPPGEGLTVVTAFPPGAVEVTPPLLVEQWTPGRAFTGSPATIPLTILTALAGLLGIGVLAYRQGRDRVTQGGVTVDGRVDGAAAPRGLFSQRVTPVQFRPPDDLRPAQLGVLVDERVDPVDVSATIVDLAVRGHLRIVEETDKILFFSKTDWRLERLPSNDPLLPYEQRLLNAVFEAGQSVKLSDLKGTFASDYNAVKDLLYDDARAQGWFTRRPDRVRGLWLGVGIALTVVGIGLVVLAALFTTFALAAVPIVVAGLVLTVAHRWMPHRTAAGSRKLDETLGFRQFINTAEAGRAEFAEQQNLFVKFLPYAVVFGAVDKWARAFGGLDAAALSAGVGYWYVGSSADGFQINRFSAGLSDFSSSVGGTLPVAPASSGGSGFSGGGSGGGFGGGGGGSW